MDGIVLYEKHWAMDLSKVLLECRITSYIMLPFHSKSLKHQCCLNSSAAAKTKAGCFKNRAFSTGV
jgi:hypothetical protein